MSWSKTENAGDFRTFDREIVRAKKRDNMTKFEVAKSDRGREKQRNFFRNYGTKWVMSQYDPMCWDHYSPEEAALIKATFEKEFPEIAAALRPQTPKKQ